MDKRIKEIRKSLGFTQDEFAKRIGLARNSIANYEIGRREPTNAIILSICKEFNVNEIWLRTGEGEMFNRLTRNQEIQNFANNVMEELDESFRKRFVTALSKLKESDWETLEKIVNELNKGD